PLCAVSASAGEPESPRTGPATCSASEPRRRIRRPAAGLAPGVEDIRGARSGPGDDSPALLSQSRADPWPRAVAGSSTAALSAPWPGPIPVWRVDDGWVIKDQSCARGRGEAWRDVARHRPEPTTQHGPTGGPTLALGHPGYCG